MPAPKAEPPHHKPEAEFVVSDPDTLKVLADPLRLQIIELMTAAPRTVKWVNRPFMRCCMTGAADGWLMQRFRGCFSPCDGILS